jgi:Uma2 family endonuclease
MPAACYSSKSAIPLRATTVRYKVPLYARHSIPEVWLVDLQAKELVAYRRSNGTAYASTTTIRSSALGLATLAEVSIDIAGLAKLM